MVWSAQSTCALQVDASFLVGSQAGGVHECGLAVRSAGLQAWEKFSSGKGTMLQQFRGRPSVDIVRTEHVSMQVKHVDMCSGNQQMLLGCGQCQSNHTLGK